MKMVMPVDSAVTVPVNVAPLLDDTDFKTIETGVAYNAAGLTLVWNFVTSAGVQTQTAVTPTNTGGNYDWTNKGNGMYNIEIPASGGASINNDTEGYGWFSGVATGVLPWVGPIISFVPAAVVNSLVNGSDNLQVDLVQIGGDTQSSTDLKDFADAGYDPSTNKIQGLVLADTVTTLTNLPAITSNWLTAAGIATDARAVFQSEAEDALVTHRLDELLNADSDIDGAAPPTVGSVFHELMSKSTGSFTFDQTADSLEALRDRGDLSWITATGFSTHSAADVWAVATRVLTAATNISGPIADQVWEEAIADHSGTAGSTAEALNAAGSAGDPWVTALPGAYGAGSAGFILGTYLTGNSYTRLGAPAGASIAADIAAVKSDTAAILLDTGTDGVVVNAAGLATDAVNEIRNAITGGAYALSTDASGMIRIVDGTGTGELNTDSGLVTLTTASVGAVADQVWEEAIADHSGTSGSTAEALNAAGSAGDPWVTSLPGAYGAGSAGFILGTYLTGNAYTRLGAPAGASVSADIAAIKAETEDIGVAGAGLTNIPWNASWDAEVQSECNDAIENKQLHHLVVGQFTISNPGSATTTVFNTDLTAADDAYNDQVIKITSGVLIGQTRSILDYSQTNGQITLAEALTGIPANGVTAVLISQHVHPISQIQSGLATQASVDVIDGIVDTILVDTNELQTDWTDGGRLDLLIDAIKAKTDNLPASPAAVGSAMTLTSGERDSIATAHLDLTDGVETNITVRKALRAISAKSAGLISGAGTGTETIKGIGQSSGGTTRLTATVDSSGNITAWTLNL